MFGSDISSQEPTRTYYTVQYLAIASGFSGGISGINMSIQLDCKTVADDSKKEELHHIPCKIDYNGPANVKQYFKCNIRPSTDTNGNVYWRRSFRHSVYLVPI